MSGQKSTTLDWYRPGLGESWLIAGLMVLSGLVFGLFIGLAKSIAPGPLWEIQSLSYLLTFVIPAIYIASRARAAKNEGLMTGVSPFAVNHPSFGPLGAFAVFAIAAVALVSISVISEPTTSFLPMPDYFKAIFETAFVNTALWDAILSTCILAPILEELLCRGIMMRGMLRTTKPWKAIFWSAFIFAFIHLNPWQAIPAFIIGLFFGWVYYRTRCLWLTIFLHCLNNSISVAITRLLPDVGIDEGLIDILPHNTYVAVYIAGCLLLAGAVILLNKYLPKRNDE